MSRTLVLMRHATAEGWSAAGDKGRHLTEAGRAEARGAGAELAGLGITHVLCSSATRTRETLDALGLSATVEYMDALYNCEPEVMAQRIGEVDDQVPVLLVVGHSPAVPMLTASLLWEANRAQADEVSCGFPTASRAVLDVDGPWSSVADGAAARLVGLERPGR